jgi:uncharacterized ubiquitin-like protein YukD
MQNVIITIKSSTSPEVKDFEVPASMMTADIMTRLQESLALNKSRLSEYRLRSDDLGIVLHADATLEQAGIWDGSKLTIIR